MLEVIHRLGSRIRHSSYLRGQTWLWESVEPLWQGAFHRALKNRGFATHVNGDVFLLDYALGARYDREDHRSYEPVFYNSFVQRVQPGMKIADIGAHFGFFTLGAALRVGDQGKVYAFEPSPETAGILESNVLFNRWQDRIEIVRSVVSDTDGLVSFYTYGTSMAASLSRENVERLNPERPPAAAETKVPSVTLDQFCKSRGVTLDLVKIDVEGAELLTLQGAQELLRRDRPLVLCEIHPLQMQKCGSSQAELNSFLSEIDYRMDALDDPNLAGIFHGLLSPR
jgi:FkbM family methyltransferase